MINLKKKAANTDNIFPFRRPVPGVRDDSSPFMRHLTYRNVVLGLGVAAFLIFLGSAVSARIAFLFAALLGLAALMLTEMASRRRWEAQLLERLERMNDEFERVMRDVARNRNDMAALKKNLSDAGARASSYIKTPGETAEKHMLHAIVSQLSRLQDVPVEADIEIQKDLLPNLTGDDVGKLTDEQVMGIVKAAVRQDKIDLFLQPIVNLPQRKTRFHEMLSRIRVKQDLHLPAGRYISVAMEHDLVPVIDNLLLLRGLQYIRDTEADNPNRAFFCNITSLTLNDPKFMSDLVEFIAQNRALAPRLVFELGQRDLATMSPDAMPVLQGLAQLGCRFSMDQVKSLSFDFAHLDARHIRFIKVEAELLLQELKNEDGLKSLKRLKSELDRAGIDLIAEKIETERALRDLLDIEIDYGQGFLFGRPAAADKTI